MNAESEDHSRMILHLSVHGDVLLSLIKKGKMKSGDCKAERLLCCESPGCVSITPSDSQPPAALVPGIRRQTCRQHSDNIKIKIINIPLYKI